MKIFLKILILFIFVSACNYKPIFSSTDASFAISDFKLINENKITQRIKRSLSNYTDLTRKKVFILEIDATKTKEITSKNSKGNISSFRISIICNFKIYEKKKLLK